MQFPSNFRAISEQICILIIEFLFSFQAGEEVEQERAAAVPGGSGNAQGPAASQHCQILRLLGGDPRQAQVHRPRHRAHDLGHSKNVIIHPFPSNNPSLNGLFSCNICTIDLFSFEICVKIRHSFNKWLIGFEISVKIEKFIQ